VGRVGEGFFAYAVVGGLAVFETFAAGDIGEGEEEVVDVVVARVVGGSGFADEVGELGEEFGTGGFCAMAGIERRRVVAVRRMLRIFMRAYG
jgi:hypothetical protein